MSQAPQQLEEFVMFGQDEAIADADDYGLEAPNLSGEGFNFASVVDTRLVNMVRDNPAVAIYATLLAKGMTPDRARALCTSLAGLKGSEVTAVFTAITPISTAFRSVILTKMETELPNIPAAVIAVAMREKRHMVAFPFEVSLEETIHRALMPNVKITVSDDYVVSMHVAGDVNPMRYRMVGASTNLAKILVEDKDLRVATFTPQRPDLPRVAAYFRELKISASENKFKISLPADIGSGPFHVRSDGSRVSVVLNFQEFLENALTTICGIMPVPQMHAVLIKALATCTQASYATLTKAIADMTAKVGLHLRGDKSFPESCKPPTEPYSVTDILTRHKTQESQIAYSILAKGAWAHRLKMQTARSAVADWGKVEGSLFGSDVLYEGLSTGLKIYFATMLMLDGVLLSREEFEASEEKIRTDLRVYGVGKTNQATIMVTALQHRGAVVQFYDVANTRGVRNTNSGDIFDLKMTDANAYVVSDVYMTEAFDPLMSGTKKQVTLAPHLTWPVVRHLVNTGIKNFAAKVFLPVGPFGSPGSLFADGGDDSFAIKLLSRYNVKIAPGGRVHNGEFFIVCSYLEFPKEVKANHVYSFGLRFAPMYRWMYFASYARTVAATHLSMVDPEWYKGYYRTCFAQDVLATMTTEKRSLVIEAMRDGTEHISTLLLEEPVPLDDVEAAPEVAEPTVRFEIPLIQNNLEAGSSVPLFGSDA